MSDMPNKLSGKITVFVTLTLGLLVYQFYSAILVSFLLNVPVSIITNIQGILDQGFNIGYEDVLYSRSLLEVKRHIQTIFSMNIYYYILYRFPQIPLRKRYIDEY